MLDQDWNDDTDHRSAVRRARIMTAIALVVVLLVTGIGIVAVFGVWLFLELVEMLSR
ncbi:hypothetical protein [Streptomyces sp. NPDC049887]|uniref:hypothetical protein n=1 Tax=unclassified Streptomyces TaxID=2593676 RepID=UPI00343FFBFD